MASYNPPTELITQFNSSLFNQPEETLSQAEADTLYLSKKKNDTSTAPLTTFTGAVNSYGDLSVGVRGVSGGILNAYRRFRIWDINNASQTYGDLIATGTDIQYSTLNQGSAIQTYHRFYTCPSTSSTASLGLEVGNTTTKIFNNCEIGVSGSAFSSAVIIKNGIILNDLVTPYTTFCQLYPSGSGMTYIMNNGNNNTETSHVFKTYNTSNLSTTSLSISNSTTRVNNDFDVGSPSTSSGWFNNRFRMRIYDVNSPYTNYTSMYMIGGNEFVIGPNTYGDKVSVYTKNNLGNQIQRLEISENNTRITNSIDVGTNGGNLVSFFRQPIHMYDVQSPYTNYNQIFTNYTNALYNMIGTSTNHRFTTYNSSSNPVVSLDIYSDQNISRVPLTLTEGQLTPQSQLFQTGNDLVINNAQASATTYVKFNNVTSIETSATQFSTYVPINLLKPTYSFPLASAQYQGYYLKTTGAGTTLTTGVTKTILTTSSIPIGVWRIDFSVQNTINTGGTITQAQSFVSTTNNGGNTTAVPYTGSIIRSHVSEVYATNDVQVITSSFTYNQSTAGVLYLNLFRVFATGTYTFIGEVAITRIA